MNDNELITLKNLLREISKIAEDADITGSLESGAGRAISRYNRVLARLEELGAVSPGLFQPLNLDDGFGALVVESRLLRSSIDEGDERRRDRREHRREEAPKGRSSVDPSLLVRLAPFVQAADLANLVRECTAQNVHIHEDTITAIAPFLDSGTLGKLVREHILGSARPTAPTPPEAPQAPQAPQAPEAPEPPPAPTNPVEVDPPQTSFMLNRIPESSREIIARLADPEISDHERHELAGQLYALTAEQRDLADAE
jgi:hypothetical protein